MSMDSNDEPISEEEKHELLAYIASKGEGFTPVHIFNSILDTGSATEGLETLATQHENALGLHGFMAGFQYVVIGDDFSSDSTTNQKIVLALQTAGFLLSLMGTLLSLVGMQFFNTLSKEKPRVQVEGVFRVYHYVRRSDHLAVVTTVVLATSTLISLFEKLDMWVAIPFAVVTAMGLGVFMFLFTGIILDPTEDFYQGRRIHEYLEEKNARKETIERKKTSSSA
eukprot:CAMPEP_0117045344 /NCGR_PEP_ID=MMETSP0472-20121206/31374_1 /TAXON_ID=693140 ORGANISM="Tiarina fusus, Strain LIS" /NCGR_SAMPLE_ID=MMETSP0472 /ASSEMBLY_ACC=CAM_ASM_000603 /LENGTH=224 /DNA_ID=CAMNT_0004757319 /DNA_START=101 /DNA_END=775 /DNA_ORIENTATION=-